ncbi:MAG: MerR family DNA-binding transcriptional regulator [Leptospirales bacterium]|nr:MerR family DNA-binding transcriptional regulator [Leptospirales bacterium]
MENMTAGQLASLAHVNLQTIRYYERQGLLPKPIRDASGYRRYASIDVARISISRQRRLIKKTK